MSELRQNIITRDWVIIAPERAKRPHEYGLEDRRKNRLPTYRPDCPFCAGNEESTGEETLRWSDDRGWRVRAVLNKYSALSSTGDRVRHVQGIHRSISGVGAHEVIIEHPHHDLTTALLEIADVANILRVYQQRYLHFKADPRIEAIIIFKNHGKGAGTSLEHPHSQIAATPVVPSQFRSRIDDAIRYFDDQGICVFCETLKDELTSGTRIIFENTHFVAFIPYAALSPFHIWIFPRRHSSCFEQITEPEILGLAEALQIVLAKLYYGLDNPDYNYTIRSLPSKQEQSPYFHWYIAIIPRITQTAGFEMGSGMYINASQPEESAEYLRLITIPS
jgi:UDPglucose--hexose-1-phosphate uridylyltransferase